MFIAWVSVHSYNLFLFLFIFNTSKINQASFFWLITEFLSFSEIFSHHCIWLHESISMCMHVLTAWHRVWLVTFYWFYHFSDQGFLLIKFSFPLYYVDRERHIVLAAVASYLSVSCDLFIVRFRFPYLAKAAEALGIKF